MSDSRHAFSVARAYRAKLTRYERFHICQKAPELIRGRSDAMSDLIAAECGISNVKTYSLPW